MVEKNLGQRLGIIGVVVLIAAMLLTFQELRPGLDIAGGVSLIFEVDDTGAKDIPDLAERVKQHLMKRVDPRGVYNLTWRVQGRNRIEVQMPLPPSDAKARRDTFVAATTELYARELRRGDIEQAIRKTGAERDATITALARRNADAALTDLSPDTAQSQRDRIEAIVAERERLLKQAAKRWDDFIAAEAALRDFQAQAPEQPEAPAPQTPSPTPPDIGEGESAAAPADSSPASMDQEPPADTPEAAGDEPPPAEEAAEPPLAETKPAPPTERDLLLARRDASELYEDAVQTVLNTNLNRRRFEDILELEERSPTRRTSLEQILDQHADIRGEIEAAIASYNAWRSGKRYLDSSADLKRLLHGAGKLEFRILAAPDPGNPTKYDRFRRSLKEGQPRPPNEDYGWFKVDNPIQFFDLDSTAELESFDPRAHPRFVVDELDNNFYVLAYTAPNKGLLQGGQSKWRLQAAKPDRDEHGHWSVSFRLDDRGGDLFQRLTSTHIDQPLCILVDDVAYSAPNIRSAIRTSGQITGEFSLDKVRYLVQTMEGGMLPARVKETPLSERVVGSSLGETNRARAVNAGIWGTLAVVVIMVLFYRLCGVVAVIAMSLNVALVLAALAMLNARITLDGIAGIILAVGMAVDANVLIYERMREEKERGASFRLIIKNGYDKALSTIFDSNITTLLTCVIIYYVGSEEVKGFGLTLGWGIVLNLFTSIFVTRTLFAVLIKYNLMKDISMLRLIGVPKVDWYAKRKFFLPVSAIILLGGLTLLYQRGRDAFDVEFRGGVAAEVELKQKGLDDRRIAELLASVGNRIANEEAPLVEEAAIEPVPGEIDAYFVRAPGIDLYRLAAFLTEPLEEAGLLRRGGLSVDPAGGRVRVEVEPEVTLERLAGAIHGLRGTLATDGANLAKANVNAVLETGGTSGDGLVWNVVATVTNMRLVENALRTSLGDQMRIDPSIAHVFRGRAGAPYPITDRLLSAVVPDLPVGMEADLTNYFGGAAIYLEDLDPPQTADSLMTRLANMYFQPDFQDLPHRDRTVIGVRRAAGYEDADPPVYASVVIASVDPEMLYRNDEAKWESAFAKREVQFVEAALQNEQTLRKVMQFKPQIAVQSQRQASLALLLSWGMIIGYVWIRFGKPIYGAAGVVALIHDALIALAFVGISGWIGGVQHPIGNALLITDFKIDMTIVAAMLTIIGYSINDTIVVFDRVRETRGRLGLLTPEIINASINQTLSRTVMTSMTTLAVLLVMYVFGGGSIRGFNFCMIIGILTGTYSTIAIATPLLLARIGGARAAVPATA